MLPAPSRVSYTRTQRNAEGLEQLPNQECGVRGASHPAKGHAPQFVTLLGYGEVPQAPLKNRPRSLSVPFLSYCICWRHRRSDRCAMTKAFYKFTHGRPLGATPDLSKEIIGERHPFEGSSGLQFAVKCVGDVSNLDHLRHVYNIHLCEENVNMLFA